MQLSEVLTNQVGSHRAQFFERIVTRQYRAGVDPAGVAGFDIVFHVADKDRLIAVELVLVQDVVDFRGLVLDADVRLGDERPDAETSHLCFVGVQID